MAYSYSMLHSFVNFDNDLDDVVLPAYNSFAIAFQFKLPPGDFAVGFGTVAVEITDLAGSTIAVIGSAQAIDLCANAVITGLSEDDFPTVDYQTKEDLFVALQLLGYSATGFNFYQCSCEDLPGSVNEAGVTITFSRGVIAIVIENIMQTEMEGIVAMGQCFRYRVTIGTTPILSNPFMRVDNSFITWMKYSSNESMYDLFYPSDTIENRLWLPMNCSKPKLPVDRKIYPKSNKTYKILKANIENEWEVKVNYFPFKIHSKIAVAHAHDNVYYNNKRINGSVFQKDEYKIDWDEAESDRDDEGLVTAQATFTVLLPFAGRNSNCERRMPCDITTGDDGDDGCISVTITGTPHLADATVGVPYDENIILNGDGPHTLTNIVNPPWMAVTMDNVAHVVRFTGTPTSGNVGSNITVSFRALNCAGIYYVPYSDTIDVKPQAATNTVFYSTTHIASDATHVVEIANVVGTPNSTVTIKLTAYVNTNSNGHVLKDNVEVFQDFQFDMVLDSAGLGSFDSEIDGAVSGVTVSIVRATYGIIAVSAGLIGNNATYQISKTFS